MMYVRLGLGLLIITQIFGLTIPTDESKTLVDDYKAMEEALNVAKTSTTGLNSQVKASHELYKSEFEIALNNILLEVVTLTGSTNSELATEIETFNNDTHTKFENLTNEGLSLQRQLFKIEFDLGDWVSLTEDIEKYEATWTYLPALFESHRNTTGDAYTTLTSHIKDIIINEEVAGQQIIKDMMYDLKVDLFIESAKIETTLNTAKTDATSLITATKKYLTNFET